MDSTIWERLGLTGEETAEEIAVFFCQHNGINRDIAPSMAALLTALIARERAEEREACARVCDERNMMEVALSRRARRVEDAYAEMRAKERSVLALTFAALLREGYTAACWEGGKG